ncbi:hypothetical protein PUMCH_001664 [Australozyma saopauloensis]|uniref:Uncharacterized protein n=1 Tax=Australozyma saopauloensis TaxID=291208 RepID=A0AAX4H7K4_9ASCO|nr:hypothetical protein PUMCH_001664 [[Candida] saopauloensis]
MQRIGPMSQTLVLGSWITLWERQVNGCSANYATSTKQKRKWTGEERLGAHAQFDWTAAKIRVEVQSDSFPLVLVYLRQASVGVRARCRIPWPGIGGEIAIGQDGKQIRFLRARLGARTAEMGAGVGNLDHFSRCGCGCELLAECVGCDWRAPSGVVG